MASLLVRKPGMLTTVQDTGRWGFQDSGVPVAGPMDAWSHRLANRLVGNPDEAAALEITLIGPDLEFESSATFAIAGPEFPAALDGVPVRLNEAMVAGAGSRLSFGVRTRGTRGYLAVAGGIDVEPTFESRATHLLSGMGPTGGRALVAGDRLPIGTPVRQGRLRAKVINTQLRYPDEFLHHKILDLIGDLYLLGLPVRGRIVANMTSHGYNQALVQRLYQAIQGSARKA